MDSVMRRKDDEIIGKLFEKLEDIKIAQIRQEGHIERINRTLYKDNGETCVVTSLKELNTSLDELKNQRKNVITTAQAIWAIAGFFATTGVISLGVLLTIKQLGWIK